jgi:anaerobic magnesium-protoporphyrin IX monomethyl ester cyclase
MERGITVEEVRAAVQLTKSRGIGTGMFLMWGYVGEELDDIEATIEHVKRSGPDIYLTTVVYPIKGTPYFREVEPLLVGTKPWEQGSTRDFLIRGRHSRSFHKRVNDLLKAEVELERLTNNNSLPPPDPSRVMELQFRIARAREEVHSSQAEVEA